MNSNLRPFQAKTMGQEPDRRGASLYATARSAASFIWFWMRPFDQLMRTVSTSLFGAQAEDQRHAVVDLLLVLNAGLHFHLAARTAVLRFFTPVSLTRSHWFFVAV